jgi:hypothetical protein
VHLRHLRIKDSSLFAFIKSPHFAKKRLIEPILKQFPKRKFILVGDSGEKGTLTSRFCFTALTHDTTWCTLCTSSRS